MSTPIILRTLYANLGHVRPSDLELFEHRSGQLPEITSSCILMTGWYLTVPLGQMRETPDVWESIKTNTLKQGYSVRLVQLLEYAGANQCQRIELSPTGPEIDGLQLEGFEDW